VGAGDELVDVGNNGEGGQVPAGAVPRMRGWCWRVMNDPKPDGKNPGRTQAESWWGAESGCCGGVSRRVPSPKVAAMTARKIDEYLHCEFGLMRCGSSC